MVRKYTTKNQGRRVLPRIKATCHECKKVFLTAHRMERCPKCVAREKMKIYRAEYSKNPYKDEIKVTRKCLKCSKEFKSINSMRVCDQCKTCQE